MDTRKLADILQASIDPNRRQQAEEQLAQIHKIIGFAPSLLHVVMSNEIAQPIRQAGVIYLKNFITQGWHDREPEEGEPLRFSVHEQDRAMIRDSIVEAVVQAPEIIKIQLCVCVKNIIKHDFPGRWTQIIDKISIYIQNQDPSCVSGALLCLYQLMKNYEFQTSEKRAPLIEAMNLLLPMMYNLMVRLLPDQSDQSVLLQKLILKNFYALIKYILPLELISKESFSQWMEILCQIADTPVPEQTLQVDEDDRPDLPWWKLKKWAVHTLHRLFERYGSPMNAREEYVEFANWYLVTFTAGILEVLLKILDQYRKKVYIAPRVLQQTLSYIDQSVSHGHSWKLLKPHMFAIIQDVLFPLMSYSEEDEELWSTDPHEYIRIKFDLFEDFVSPVTAAQTVLISCCKKRKDMLQKTMQFCMEVLTSQTGAYGPRQRDGALHMVGSLSDVLIKKKLYKGQMDSLLTQYVFPEFKSPLGYMRARACWVLHYFAGIHFKDEKILVMAVNLTVNALLTDCDLPVKVEAAIAMQMLLTNQDNVYKYLKPQIQSITLELLKIIRETENDDLTSVMQKIVPMYTEQLMPISVEICEHLAKTFSQVLETDSNTDEKAITAMALLNTIETLLRVMENNQEVMQSMEGIVLKVITHILSNSVIEYYEEALSLLADISSKTISEEVWGCVQLLYEVFEKDGADYFGDMMPILYNYVTVDTEAFLANENNILALFNMCKTVLTGDSEEEAEVFAAKLLEVMVLQFNGRIDHCLPSFVELILGRLTRKVKTSELRTMALQVLIAILYCNPHLLFTIINKLQESVTSASITEHFIKQWLNDTDCFLGLHDRKICVLGLCTLLEMGMSRPPLPKESIYKILPSLLLLFSGLKRAYEARADNDDDDSSDEGEEDDEEGEVLSSDDDELEDMNADFLEKLARQANSDPIMQSIGATARVTEYEDSDNEDFNEETSVEIYTTPLDELNCPVDEYIIFKDVLTGMSSREPALYSALTAPLNEEQQKCLREVLVLAEQRRAQQDSKRIEQSGGYAFKVPDSVPTKFKFGLD